MAQVDATLTLQGASGLVDVTLEGMPVRTEPGGRPRYAYPDFGSDFIEVMFRGVFAVRSGPPWRRTTACRVCGAALVGTEQPTEITVKADLRDIPSFAARFRMPAVRCGGCGVWQALPRHQLEVDVSQALVNAFDAAHVKPG